MSRAVLRCQACRYSLLDAFTSLAGVSPSSQWIHRLPTTPAPLLSRRIHSTARRFQSIQAQKAFSDTNDEAQPSTASEAPHTEAQPIPWYLEIDNPEPPGPTLSSPILARQQIPPLPSNPPSVLLPLLNHLSISIGLDDLTLIDLRTLSPPPALGANLIMIIGTARSVKHLNVSADRFCRWLRTNYKLRPYADGLLGRNELKLKLRRKARRLKLERAAGRQSDENVDDGITTGWVCVNVGPVDHVVIPAGSSVGEVVQEAPLAEEDIDDGEEYVNPEEPEVDEVEVLVEPTPDHDVDPAYVGFGSRATSQRIVVQMFTEEKRAEMNLEELWNARNMRRIIKEEKADARAEYARKQKEMQERERKKAGAKAKAVQEGGEYMEDMLRKLEDLSVEEKEELRRRIEVLRLEEGEGSGEKMKEDPKWSPIFNVKS